MDVVIGFLGAIIAGGTTILATMWLKRPDKTTRKEREQRRFLVEDEIIGHKDVPGVVDKDGLGVRTARMELILGGVQRELHPNGGASLADKVNETHRMVAQGTQEIAATAVRVAEVNEIMEQHARDDSVIWKDLVDKLLVISGGQELAARTAISVAAIVQQTAETAARLVEDRARATAKELARATLGTAQNLATKTQTTTAAAEAAVVAQAKERARVQIRDLESSPDNLVVPPSPKDQND
jgi:hypothetical protein